jgi:2'-5' RNA ligase
MRMESLYFIAILAPPDIAERVTAIKNEIAERFESRHALKLPPHITLQPPFLMNIERLESLKGDLTNHFRKFSSTKLVLDNFGNFRKRRNPVIFIQVKNNSQLAELHKKLMLFLRKTGFHEEKTSLEFHPHMTVAHRDLSQHNFRKAWREFQNKFFNMEFVARSVHLLKHDGEKWTPILEFELKAV